jgi:hypothetical protein
MNKLLINIIQDFIKQKNPDLVRKPLDALSDSPEILFYKGRLPSSRTNLAKIPEIVILPTIGSFREMSGQITRWLSCGVREVVIIDDEVKAIQVYTQNCSPRIYDATSTLTLQSLHGLSIDLSRITHWTTPKRLKAPTKTLLDPTIFRKIGENYPHYLRTTDFSKSSIIERDVEVFRDVTEDDIALCNRIWLAGPLKIAMNAEIIDCTVQRRAPICISHWVEKDRLRFIKNDAKGILYVGDNFLHLWKIRAWKRLGLILVSGFGIPRLIARRLLHRMSSELGLPVYLFSNNDVWGYFTYSVIKRGSIAPHMFEREFAVEDLRFLGAQAGELSLTDDPSRYLIPRKPYWELRLKAIEKYSCFKSQAWRHEFAEFRRQGGEFNDISLAAGLRRRLNGKEDVWKTFVDQYFLIKLESRKWLS